MQFKTNITLTPFHQQITHQQNIFCIGSCFAHVMGLKMQEAKFKVINNPFGTIYNPLSIIDLLNFSIDQNFPESESYVQNQGLIYNYYMHGDISDLSYDNMEKKVIKTIENSHHQLKISDWLMITLGTAFVYLKKYSHTIVANCHKVPAGEFERRMLKIPEITEAFDNFLKKLKNFNPGIRIIITVSPVRHLRDGLPQNSVSKATLRLACQHLVETYDFIDYFPSFEFMLDDLRDYRFYGDDLVHPSKMAEEYIWQNFQHRYMHEETRQLIKEWSKIVQALNHRPYYPNSPQHQDFLRKTIEKLYQFKNKLDVHNELGKLKKQLI
ncbi:MAG: GSCFA domain-containing protein [Cyclobacteriaceae bacterium]